jgi:hypothetical protein
MAMAAAPVTRQPLADGPEIGFPSYIMQAIYFG